MRKRKIKIQPELYKGTYIEQVKAIIPVWYEWNKQVQKNLDEFTKITAIEKTNKTEIKNLKLSIVQLETYYSVVKERVIEKLQKDITEVVNLWYDNNYDFYINTVTSRGKVYTTLMDRKRKGRLFLVCGGAVKQTLGVLFNFAFIRSMGSEFIFLDETFSSLGINEVNRLPDVFNMLNNIQLICIEHKCELIDKKSAASIWIHRQHGESSYYTIDDPNNHLKESVNEINNVAVNERDEKILLQYGYDLSATREYRKTIPTPQPRLTGEMFESY